MGFRLWGRRPRVLSFGPFDIQVEEFKFWACERLEVRFHRLFSDGVVQCNHTKDWRFPNARFFVVVSLWWEEQKTFQSSKWLTGNNVEREITLPRKRGLPQESKTHSSKHLQPAISLLIAKAFFLLHQFSQM